MPAVARGNSRDGVNTEHGCAGATRTSGGSFDVLVNGTGVHRHNDDNVNHTIPCGDSCCGHSARIMLASPNVLANGKGVARQGDRYNNGCGSVSSGSNNVLANGG